MFRTGSPMLLLGLLFAHTAINLAVSTAMAQQWPQWRGSSLNSVSLETSLLSDISDNDSLKWRLALPGPGGSSPIVFGDRIFLTTPEGKEDGAKMFLMCVGTDGKIQWKKELVGTNQNHRDNSNSASPSPSTDGKHVWCMMSNGVIQCFTVAGEPVWQKNLQEEYGKFDIQFGMTTTPILDKGVIYVSLIHGDMRSQKKTSEGDVVALDAATGKEIWHQKRLTDGVAENLHSYASPVIYRDETREFLVTHGADYVIAHSLKDGSEIWRCGGFNIKGPSYNPYLRLVASPTCIAGMIVVPTAKRGPVIALKPDMSGDLTNDDNAKLWKLDVGTPDVASPVIDQGLVYLADERGVLVCLDGKTGEVVYQQRMMAGNHRSTPIAADGKLFITGRDGIVYVVEGGNKFELLSKLDLKEETTASPAIANGVVYVRTFEALYAFSNK